MLSQRGFTVLELVLILLIAAVLWWVQLRTVSLIGSEFKQSFEKYVAANVDIGVLSYFVDPKRGNLKRFPPALDAVPQAPCSGTSRCFEEVLPGGVTMLWTKTGAFEYLGPAGGNHRWRYEPDTGRFYESGWSP